MSMRVLVSGGFGYIGSHLVSYLLKQGIKLGILSKSKPKSKLGFEDDIHMYKADLSKKSIHKIYEEYDVFVHLAAANDRDSLNSEIAIKNTTLATKNALEVCTNNNINKFIYFSTFQVYGSNKGFFDESKNPKPMNDYALTHYFAEQLLQMYQKKGDIEGIIFRPTNVYGAPASINIDRWSLVPNCFCKEAIDSDTITLNSSGRQLRDFVSLRDVARFTHYSIENFQDLKNKTVNLASGKSISILEVAEMVSQSYSEIFGRDCKLKVLSEFPRHENYLEVSTQTLDNVGFIHDNKHGLKHEINKIFHLLSERKHLG